MPAIASDPIHPGSHRATWNRVAAREDGVQTETVLNPTRPVTASGSVRAVEERDDADVTSALLSWATVIDGVTLLGVVWSIAVAVLLVGTPIALTIAFLLWVVRLALAAI